MLEANGADYKEYEHKLQVQIEPLLSRLANSNSKGFSNRQVLWLNQFATNDFWGPNKNTNVDIYSEKIHRYNLIVQRIFK